MSLIDRLHYTVPIFEECSLLRLLSISVDRPYGFLKSVYYMNYVIIILTWYQDQPHLRHIHWTSVSLPQLLSKKILGTNQL